MTVADGMVPVVVTPEPFGRGKIDLELHAGSTVRDLLRQAVEKGLAVEDLGRAEIYVNGARQDRQTVLDRKLALGDVVNVVVEPLGGGGGGDKDVGQILLMVAVIAVSSWVGGGASGRLTSKLLARMLAAGITMIGQAVIAGMNRPKSPQKANDRYALQGASNQYRQYAPQPVALGEVVVAPDLAAKTFTQSSGDDVWMYGILALHRGPCEIAELKIGDTLASSMGAADFRMKAHLSPGPRTFEIYPNDVDQLDLQVELEADASTATPVVRAASSEGERFDFDFYLPKGLYFQKGDGRVESVSVSVAVRYRAVDIHGTPTGSWATAASWSRSAASKDPIRATHSITLPLGRYEFEVTRNKHADNNDSRNHDIFWTALKAVAYRKPVVDEVLSVIEFAVRATAVNQGSLAPITCRIKPLVPVFDGTDWDTEAVSSNPADLARWLLTGPCAAIPLQPAQADYRLREWRSLCVTYDWTAHHYLTEEDLSQEAALALLEQSGRASLFWDGTQLAAACWVEKPAPKQMFTGANLKDHSFEIVYPDEVHALRVQFANIDKTGELDEVIVYADGYGEFSGGGLTAATLYEVLQVEGQMKPERAYRNGRWALGQRIHQRRFDNWSTDVEHLAVERGDRARLAYTRATGGSLRVRTRRYSGGLVSGIRLTEPVEMEAGKDYVVDIRTASGLYSGVPVETVPGVVRELVFSTPRAVALSPKAGDLVAFGEPERVTEDVEIVAIEPGENLTAVLTGVRYVAPLLIAGETGPIPPLVSNLTGDRMTNPPTPILLGAQFDANGVRISFEVGPWRGSPLSGFTVRWRSKPASGEVPGWESLPPLDASARVLRTPPVREAPVTVSSVDATRIEVEIVAATVDGRVSRPLTITVSQPPPPIPTLADWTVVAKPAASDGSQLPFLLVTGTVNHPDVANVRISFSPSDEGPWTEAYFGPPQTSVYQVGPLISGVDYYVRITFLSAQGIPSASLVKDAVTAPGNVASNVIATAPSLVALEAQIRLAFGDIFDVSGLLADARADLDAVEAEVVAARGGSANLAARVAAVNQARIDGDTANASAISGVLARTAQTEADIIDLENAQAGEAVARAEAVSQLTARMSHRPNLIDNPSGASGFRGWIKEGGPDTYVLDDAAAGRIFVVVNYMVSQVYPAAAGDQHSLSFNASPVGGSVRIQYITSSGVVEGVSVNVGSGAITERRRSASPSTAPTGTTGFRLVVAAPPVGVLPVWAIKVNMGSVATEFSDDYSATVLEASVIQQSLAIIDLENQQSIASWYVKAAASGGKPAVLGVFSSTYGSGIALGAEQVFLGDNTTIDTVTQTQQGVWGSTRRVIANGPPFGPDNLIHWAGPSNIALSAMTKANAGFWQDQNGMYGPTPVPLFWAKATPSVVTKTRTGAGSIATNVNDVIVTCLGGTSGATCTWSRVSGDASISFPSSGFTPTFSTTLTVGQIKTAVFAGLVIKGGETALVYLTVEFQETT